MQKLLLLMIALVVGIVVLVPSAETSAPPAPVARQQGLFEAPAYKETVLERTQDGHFYVTADVNGAPIRFIVDTGASSVALSQEDARAAGLQFSPDEFEPVARTANGIARGKIVTLPKVTIEGKEVMEVEGMILEDSNVSLLGQSYLARISGVEMSRDTMVLR